MDEITVVALGPDRAKQRTLEAAEALARAPRLILRTGRHGAADWLRAKEIPFETLDALYERAEDFDALNEEAAQAVLAAAPVCYAVPDPASDATVEALRAHGARLNVLAGVTQANLAAVSALAAGLPAVSGVCTVTASALGEHRVNPSLALLVTELNSRLLAGEVKLRLLEIYPPSFSVHFDGSLLPLEALDRQRRYDHLSCVYLPPCPMQARSRYTFDDLLDVMARLRNPVDGCPWDREQTHESLREYLIEEAYEAVDAINSGDMERMADELGDVLLQVVFHARVAQEHGEFDIVDVTTAICRKMVSRHAHIFGDAHCDTAEDVVQSWEAIKKREKGLQAMSDVMRDVPVHFPALMRASKVQKKARQVGFDWQEPGPALAKVCEEANEVRAELEARRDPKDELGDLLFAAVNVSRLCGVQPELALGAATDKFIRRFSAMEQAIRADGKSMETMDLPEMDRYWDAVKRSERGNT